LVQIFSETLSHYQAVLMFRPDDDANPDPGQYVFPCLNDKAPPAGWRVHKTDAWICQYKMQSMAGISPGASLYPCGFRTDVQDFR
jgi:hypothetical protein